MSPAPRKRSNLSKPRSKKSGKVDRHRSAVKQTRERQQRELLQKIPDEMPPDMERGERLGIAKTIAQAGKDEKSRSD